MVTFLTAMPFVMFVAGAVFCGYVLYDTISRIMGRKH